MLYKHYLLGRGPGAIICHSTADVIIVLECFVYPPQTLDNLVRFLADYMSRNAESCCARLLQSLYVMCVVCVGECPL